MVGKQIIKGIVEAVNAKPHSEGIKVGGRWLNPNERTRRYVAHRAVGEAVYLEVEGDKIVFCGDLRPDDPDRVQKAPLKGAQAAQTAKNSPFQPPSGQIHPPIQNPPIKPKLALSQTDRLIIAQVCEKGAIEATCAVIAASCEKANPVALEEIAGNMVDRLARKLEKDLLKRLNE